MTKAIFSLTTISFKKARRCLTVHQVTSREAQSSRHACNIKQHFSSIKQIFQVSNQGTRQFVKYRKNPLNPLSAISPLAFTIQDETPCEGIVFSRQGIPWRACWTSLTGIRYFVNLQIFGEFLLYPDTGNTTWRQASFINRYSAQFIAARSPHC